MHRKAPSNFLLFVPLDIECGQCGEYYYSFHMKKIEDHSTQSKAQDKGALCILDEEESEATHYYCVCAEGFVGDPNEECKPKIEKEPCEKCG